MSVFKEAAARLDILVQNATCICFCLEASCLGADHNSRVWSSRLALSLKSLGCELCGFDAVLRWLAVSLIPLPVFQPVGMCQVPASYVFA